MARAKTTRKTVRPTKVENRLYSEYLEMMKQSGIPPRTKEDWVLYRRRVQAQRTQQTV